jgi:hypothetical protein
VANIVPAASATRDAGVGVRRRVSMIDDYANDGGDQHRTKHDVDRFKRISVPHGNYGIRA